jgi:hypothetical protein
LQLQLGALAREISGFASRDFVYKISDFSSTVRDFSPDTEAQKNRRLLSV